MRQKLLCLQPQKAAADSSSLGLEEISSCSSGRNSILSPHLQQGFHLPCQLSAQNVSGLSDWSFQRRPCLSAWLPPHFPFKARNEFFYITFGKIKSWCAFCNLNNRNNADAFDKFHSHTLCSHTGPATHDSKQFSCLLLRCHKHYKFQKVLSGCLFFFLFFFASCSLRRLCHSSPGAGWLCGLRLLEGSPWIRSKVATEACFKTNGWANEPLKAPLICPMALLEKPRWGSCSGRERLRYGCGVCGGCPSCGVIGWSRRGSQHDVGWSKWAYGRASSSLRLHLPGHWGVWAKC